MPTARPCGRQHRHTSSRFTLGGLATVAICAGLTTSASASSAAPAAAVGGIGLRLVSVPVSQLNDPRARIYIVDHVAPGTVVDRQIEVSNTTASTMHIVLYAAAATIANDSFLGAAGHTPNAVSSWTAVTPSSAEVPGGGGFMATVSIAVPPHASSGEQYGAVWAQVSSGPSAGGVTQVSRVGIRIYLSVGFGRPPASNFTIELLTAERSSEGRPRVLATVHNTGGLALDMSGNLKLLSGPGGIRAGPFPATLGTTLAVGDTEPVTFFLDKRLPAGPWDALITLQSGLFERSAQATITFPETGASSPMKTRLTGSKWLYLAFAGLLILLLMTIAALLVLLGRLRRRTSRDFVPDKARQLPVARMATRTSQVTPAAK